MTERRRISLASIGVMAAVSLSTAVLAIYVLYEAAIETHRGRLKEVAQSRARIIEAVARFDAEFSREDIPGGATAATLRQIIEAHENFEGFGRTGEFTLARSDGNQIAWLLRHRHAGVAMPRPIPLDSHLAEPMRRALNGECGTIVGADYRGVQVLAAYEKVRGVDWGVVAKIDIVEIREPFVRAGLVVAGIALLAIAVGVVFILKLTSPLLRRIEAHTRQLGEAHQRLRLHSSEAALAVERERRKLAVDLHDGLGQQLAVACMKLGMLRNEAKAKPIDSEVREIESLVVEAHKSSGEVTFQMCPPILYDAGFLEAIRWLAGDVERLYGLQVKVEDDGQRWPLDEATRILLFRSVNELLTNVAKHAQTDEAVVRMWQQDQLMAVAVEDNGIAFDPSPEASGFGLFSVQERLHHLGGSMKVDSMPGRGTSVVLIAPFSTEGAEARRESA